MDDDEDYYDCDQENSEDDLDREDEDDEEVEGVEDEDSESLVWDRPLPSCRVITRESLVAAQNEELRKVMELLTLTEQHARTLLIHQRWNTDKLFEIFAEKGKDRLFSEAGIPMNVVMNRRNRVPKSLTCDVCMEDVSRFSEMSIMDCGHYFCNNCWTEHFIVKINEGQSRRIRCMAYKCSAVCDEVIVRKLVSERDLALAERFERFLLESYIEDNKLVKWCPSVPHCGNAIRVEKDQYCEVECVCGLQFCFRCSSEAHSPCSCSMWKLWAKKCVDESETVNWITAHTKLCPKCQKPVEKNGGCNLVRCVCGQAFCWLCGGATGFAHTWTTIEGHSCGRYKEEQESKTQKAEWYLKRYIHYHGRYKAHADSFKLESKLKETIKDKIASLESKDFVMKDFSWVTAALQRLFSSRRVLLYSYPFAFYMFGDELFSDEMTKEEKVVKQNLFEDQQQQFEAKVESLSKLIEENFDHYTEDQVIQMRMEVINLTVITDSLCKNMYECIQNDLLGSLTLEYHDIAPYKSKGIERASEFYV